MCFPVCSAMLAAFALAFASPAQDHPEQDRPAPDRRVPGRTGGDYFPLQVGSVWIYTRTDPTGARSEVEVTCRGEARSGRVTAFELGARAETGGRYEYWRVDDAGVWRHTGYSNGDMPGLVADTAARYLACPLGLETVWSWKQRLAPALAQLMGREFDAREPAPHRAQILDTGAEVEVPAGTFRTVCVQIDMQPDPGGFGQRVVMWFAPGVGPVRRETFNLDANTQSIIERDELRKFTPGPEVPPDPLEVARAFVQAHGELWPVGEPGLELVALSLGNSAMVSRFVRVVAKEGPQVLRVGLDGVAPFDLDSVSDVQAFFVAESVVAAADHTPQHLELNQFSRTYFSLRAVLNGEKADAVSTRSSRSSSSSGPGGTVRSGTFTSSRGEQLDLAFTNGKLEKLEYRPK